jgi:hypothetical protein
MIGRITSSFTCTSQVKDEVSFERTYSAAVTAFTSV